MGVSVMSFLRALDFCISYAGEIPLAREEVALVTSVEIGGIDRTGQVGDEHPVTRHVERDTDSLHQVRDQDLRHGLLSIAARLTVLPRGGSPRSVQ